MVARCLLCPLECTGDFAAILYFYTRLYAAQIILVTLLSAVTIYRREMSCNHVYVQEDVTNERNYGNATLEEEEAQREQRERQGEQWDALLEGAGKWGSGQPLKDVVLAAWGVMMRIKKGISSSSEWTEKKSEELLEAAGLSLSGEPIWAWVISLWTRIWLQSLEDRNKYMMGAVSKPSPLPKDIPPDLQVHILSFLPPKDVTSFACCNKYCNDLVDNPGSDTCLHLWKRLFDRDYGWLVNSWSVGRDARQRSHDSGRIDKRLYFEFGQSYINYLLVGHNTADSCLVGLHGNIYDITDFISVHPGSPETLLVHAGQDATVTFEAVGHSVTARKRTPALCVAVATGCGVARGEASVLERRRQPQRPATLLKIRNRLVNEEIHAQRKCSRMLLSDNLNEVVVYYDPFEREWKAWYTDYLFQTRHLYMI
jgi:hypothetical protein